MTSSENLPMKGKCMDLINESVHTVDDIDIGDIDAVNVDFIVVKRGFVNIHYYYIPIHQVEGWDGHVLWLKKTEDEIKSKYERHCTRSISILCKGLPLTMLLQTIQNYCLFGHDIKDLFLLLPLL